MTRFHGNVGFASQVETKPGVWDEVITERPYFGDVVRNSRRISEGENLNPDLSVGNSVSIVADQHAQQHFFDIRYVEWAGVRWKVSNIDVQHPRLVMQLGEVYIVQTP